MSDARLFDATVRDDSTVGAGVTDSIEKGIRSSAAE